MRIHSLYAELSFWLVASLVTVGVFVIADLRSRFVADALEAVLFVAATIGAARSFRGKGGQRERFSTPGRNSPQHPGSDSLWMRYR